MDGGLLYVGSYDNNIYTLDATKGNFLWKFATKDEYRPQTTSGERDSLLEARITAFTQSRQKQGR